MAMRDITPRKVNFSTSKTEAVHILISAVVMSIAFGIMFSRNTSIVNYFKYHLGSNMWIVGMFVVMFILVVLSFIGHEFGHKLVAQKYGMWSEYRMYPMGLVFALIMSFIGFLIAAPGAVMIRGDYITEEQNGKISIAGPIVNMVLAAIGIIGVLTCNGTVLLIPFYLLMTLNASLALFNLIPFPPLDGSKIIGWNLSLWIASIVVAGLEFVSIYFMPALYWA